MNKDTVELGQLHKELNSALALIEGSVSKLPKFPTMSPNIIQESESLLEQCEAVVAKNQRSKPVIRIIHHLACSGGTLISKCIAALPNTFLLSEIHPTTRLHLGAGKPKFSPSDITTLARYANLPNVDELAWEILENNIDITLRHTTRNGGFLVLREHTHSDYCVGPKAVINSQLVDHLKKQYDVCNLATVRHPVDCYVSMKLNNWLHFEPQSFDEYCKRYLLFLKQFDPHQIIKYEDFVASSDKTMTRIANILNLPYSPAYRDVFACFNVTGDSGRGSGSIAPRTRRALPDDLISEINASVNYAKLVKRLDYESTVTCS
tara:strand:+ start:701 stop:1660 length:960 start_codon:yes stop_codon:yes gene_type:complete